MSHRAEPPGNQLPAAQPASPVAQRGGHVRLHWQHDISWWTYLDKVARSSLHKTGLRAWNAACMPARGPAMSQTTWLPLAALVALYGLIGGSP